MNSFKKKSQKKDIRRKIYISNYLVYVLIKHQNLANAWKSLSLSLSVGMQFVFVWLSPSNGWNSFLCLWI